MPIDASIYGQFAPRVQSPMDIQNGLMQGAMARNQLAQGQMAVQQGQLSMADQQQLRNALSQGVDLSTPEGRSALMRAAPLGAMPILKQQLDMDKVRSDIALNTAHAQDFASQSVTRGLDAARAVLPMVKTPEQFGQWVDGLYQNPATSKLVTAQFGDPDQVKARIPQDPAEFQTFLKQNAMGMDKFIQDQTTQRGQNMTAQTAANEQGVQKRGQDISSATAIKTTGMREAGENTRAAATIQNQRLMAGMNGDGSINDGVQARITAIAEGREAPPSEGSRAPGAQAILNGLHTQYPTVDLPALHQRVAAIKAFGEGKQGDQVRAFDAFIGHTETLKDAATALKNGNIPALNNIANQLGVQVGNNTAVGVYKAITTAVGSEAASAITKSNVGEADRAQYLAPFSSSASPDQIIANANAVEGLGATQLRALERQYQRTASVPGMPPPKFDGRWLGPAALSILATHPDAGAAAPANLPSGWKIEKVTK